VFVGLSSGFHTGFIPKVEHGSSSFLHNFRHGTDMNLKGADIKDPRASDNPNDAKAVTNYGPDDLFWRRFAQAESPKVFCQSWLTLQCRTIGRVKHAMVLLGSPDKGPYSPVAVWPDAKISVHHLAGTAERSIRERRGLRVDRNGGPAGANGSPQTCQIAYPVEVAEQIHGVVVLEIEMPFDQDLQALMRQLHWGAGWLEVLIRRMESSKNREENQGLRNAMDLMVSVVEHENFYSSAMGFVTRMATLLDCDRVSLGFVERSHVKVWVLSHSADFNRQTTLAKAIGQAMDEAVDQRTTINFPGGVEDTPVVARAHRELERQFGSGSILTIPCGEKNRIFGSITLERSGEKPFDPQTVAFCESVVGLATPVLEVKRQEERWLIQKAVEAAAGQLKRLLGPGYPVRKLAAATLAAMIVFFTVFKVDYRVTAESSIEGQVKRVIAAPFNGYVKEASVRAGDVVLKDQVICLLDDRDVKLERFRWVTEREQLTKQYHEAMAKYDRVQIQITKAKIRQAEAQIDLLDEQHARTKLAAPFNAVVISGDLSQSLGVPVERGQVLFEVAPLDEYRGIIEVDERDISNIHVGQYGEMHFPSLPGARFPFSVQKVTPVTISKDGRNYFRVEGHIEQGTEQLRPGMAGIGKIKVDRRLLIWVWTHKMVDWMRLKIWQWMP
jgi:multidrug resistance efflux pump